MALKRLPNDVQSLLCASSQINNFKRAIEELIYNSLDAESTSIAIRLHIQESTIQVIDNGCGITKQDFNAIGRRNMTSKLNDVATLKAAPKNYGYRGEFLANITTVSQIVKITSRHENTEETWAKTFSNGKETKIAKMTTRPTKGTTVDIKGFLYNLNIQKRGIDPINELQNIKLFLEQLSLVHNNISLSLRDDSKNEIVFKIHKKRDAYQTLLTLFDINKVDILELQVEKHEYKVKGLIGKKDKNLDLQWIYLNGRFINSSSKLHKILNEYFKKYLLIKDQRKLKSKKNNDENQLFNQNIPFYFIFVTCPYIDYDVSFTRNQSVVEFKTWEQMNKLLEKLVKFYVGDVNLKEFKKPQDKQINKERTNQDTRVEVKKIMDKILGNNSKKLGVSQLQKGVKGRLVKRKVKKKTKEKFANISKSFLQNNIKNLLEEHKNIIELSNYPDSNTSQNKINLISEQNHAQHIQETTDSLKKNEHPKNLKEMKHFDKILRTRDTAKKSRPEEATKNHKKMVTPKSKRIKPYKKSIKHKKHKTINKQKKEIQHLKNTDSVYKRCKIVAKRAEEFLTRTKTSRNNIKNKKNINNKFQQNEYDNEINDDIPVPANENNNIIEKFIMNKLKTKPYKTTYDLVQTILTNQQELSIEESNMSNKCYYRFLDFGCRRKDKSLYMPKVSRKPLWANEYFSKYSEFHGEHESQYTVNVPTQNKALKDANEFKKYSGFYTPTEICDNMTSIPERPEFTCSDIYSQNKNMELKQPHEVLSGPSNMLTYDSHQYHKHELYMKNDISNNYSISKKHNVRFITKQSKDNFITSDEFRSKFKRPFKTCRKQSSYKQANTYDVRMRQTINESLYTIEYSKSNEINQNVLNSNIFANSVDYVMDKVNNQSIYNYEVEVPHNKFNTIFENTYTIHSYDSPFDLNIPTENNSKRHNMNSDEIFGTYSIHHSSVEANDDKICSLDKNYQNRNLNVVFVSKSQCSETETSQRNNIPLEPLNICETLFHSGTDEREFARSFNDNNLLNDSLYDNIQNVYPNSKSEHGENEPLEIINHTNYGTENVSHHFSNLQKNKQLQVIDKIIEGDIQEPIPSGNINGNDHINAIVITEDYPNFNIESKVNAENVDCNFEINFNLKNRLRFVPKGMSQIFENCRTKTACDYNLDRDYYEDSIYNNFANHVQVSTEIYEPVIQNVEDLATKDIHKFQNKVKKDHASLVFDESSLKEAKVLGQADAKFIVAIMKKQCGESDEATQYLILFDQHAVHERIRLEKNLADYINKEIWRSIPVDNIVLKMSKDEILYLHNYKDKFTQFGLQWTIVNDNEVTVNSIPEAILGKNAREVEKVIKAVRNLIIEEINVIKLQKGCVSLYPKSIMDLVFSEACRYAIKFGDQLSKNDCNELLNDLSKCKTPFQCAHGRPVMAVIMDIKPDRREYKINVEKLRRFKMQAVKQ